MRNSCPKILAIIGKSCSGKTSLSYFLTSNLPRYLSIPVHCVINDTTRPIRKNEHNGLDYHFLTIDEFNKREHINIKYYKEWYYGISKDEIKTGALNIIVTDPESLIELNKEYKNMTTIYLASPSPHQRLIRSIKRDGCFKFEHIRRIFDDDKHFAFFEREPNFRISLPLSNDTVKSIIYNMLANGTISRASDVKKNSGI